MRDSDHGQEHSIAGSGLEDVLDGTRARGTAVAAIEVLDSVLRIQHAVDRRFARLERHIYDLRAPGDQQAAQPVHAGAGGVERADVVDIDRDALTAQANLPPAAPRRIVRNGGALE